MIDLAISIDIALALQALEDVPSATRTKPQWYRRLRKCAAGGLQR
jgi:hypothetical protein